MQNESESAASEQSREIAVWLAMSAVVVALLLTLGVGSGWLAADGDGRNRATGDDVGQKNSGGPDGIAIAELLHNDGVFDPEWGEPVDGLRFRLRAERTTWLSWEQPIVTLDVRNVGVTTISAEELRRRLPTDSQRSLQMMRMPAPALPESQHFNLGMQLRFDAETFTKLEPDEVFSLPLVIASTALSYEGGLFASDVLIGFGHKLSHVELHFVSNLVPVRILPPGVGTVVELAKFLKQYEANGRRIEAGFVPAATTVVEGERLVLTFLVRNSSNEMFGYSFGGDYRGVNRHDRFKIEIRNEASELLPDPSGRWGNMGGIIGPREVEPGHFSSERLDLLKYRTIPGPGRYSVSARYVLDNEFGLPGHRFEIPVEANFELTILPRSPERVAAFLDRLQARCERTSHKPLEDTIEVMCEFNQRDAVPRLVKLVETGSLERRRAAVRGLGTISEGFALNELLKLESDPEIREAVLLALGAFSDGRAVARVIAASIDTDAAVRRAAATALGQMKTEAATAALLREFDRSDSVDESAVILTALGATGDELPGQVIAGAMEPRNDAALRRAAVAAAQLFNRSTAEQILRPYTEDADLDFRELVIRTLAEKLKASFKPELLAPVIRSRRGTNTIGDAPRLLRLYADDKAAPTILSCLDFDDPVIRHYYNLTVITGQLSCRTGLAIPWIGDLNRDGSPEELQKNRETLGSLKEWIAEYQQKPWSEPSEPWRLPQAQQQQSWGPEVNRVRLRARLNSSVWPSDLPQVITIDATKDGSSIVFDKRPEAVEIEVDGDWYAHDPDIEPVVGGEWHAYKGNRWHSYQLTQHWQRISDGEPLRLLSGSHTARIRVVPVPGKDRAGLVTSLPVQFRIIGEHSGRQ